jgi:fructosamine-3-kinase
VWQQIEQDISQATGKPFKVRSSQAVAGGCINEAVCLQGEQRRFFVKLNRADRLDMFEAEAAGLEAIRASHSVRAPEPIAWGVNGDNSWLALEFIPFASQQGGSSALLGDQLAAMHQHTAPQFGWERDNTIGSSPQPNSWTGDWIAFLRDHRLGFQLALAGRNGAPAKMLDRGQHLLELLPALFSDYHPQPSLLHGDLWGGNWGSDRDGSPVIFDPAVYFGDREADIAMIELFGGFDRRFYQSYESAWPLDRGYRTRKQLYNLYHILNHFNLFGGDYARQAAGMIEDLLAHQS